MNAVAFVRSAGQNLVQEDDLVHPFSHGHITVLNVRKQLGQFSQLVIVRGEQCPALQLVGNVFGDCPGQREPIVCACTAAYFVENDERFNRGVVYYVCRLGHFDHEGRLASD